ncbi:MAG: 2-oxo-4-hydroxy-4-carboxy-5-ureidoimidazoline decarboxylase [Pseudomonadota bacterium]
MSLIDFNAMADSQAREALELCCVSENWIGGMMARRPFADADGVRDAADDVWAAQGEADILQAFEGHPKIGDVKSLAAKYRSSGGLAAHEQSGVSSATDSIIQRLADGNNAYETRFGFIFIVCATGKSAAEMCALLEARLGNERDDELIIAAEEQRKILRLRLEKLL